MQPAICCCPALYYALRTPTGCHEIIAVKRCYVWCSSVRVNLALLLLLLLLPMLCVFCPAESPQWRRGPPAKPILCNACGTRYRRTHNLGPPIPSSGRPGGRQPGSSSSNGSNAANRKRPAPAATPAALAAAPVAAPAAAAHTALYETMLLPLNMEGGVHTGTRSGGSPAVVKRPVLKLART
jgi:hypothetical protein